MIGIDGIKEKLAGVGYICDEALASAVFVALSLERPLLVEGAAGVGKTEIAKAMATVLDRPLVRLQCHSGMDETRSLYEWNYQKQLLAIQVHTGAGGDKEGIMESIFSDDYLLERPLLQSIRSRTPVVLLIDELDKTDEEFEAFLLELLAEYQVSIPELGTLHAATRPFTVLTSNNARPLSDALRRRCAYAWLDYPSIDKEIEIIRARMPDADAELAREVAFAVRALRDQPRIMKKPSVAETLDWIAALEALGAARLDIDSARSTISASLKNRADAEAALTDILPDVLATPDAPASPAPPADPGGNPRP
ncbi:MAG: MoxR family ATPase [Clostridiales Family XIII bacterium]|jgi:MoxR-like ATPase|nr:MoxR family ATPase [Clostridiales Family XIII bacterium]